MEVQRKIRCIAFDFDGTLVDSFPLVNLTMVETLRRCGINEASVPFLDPYWGPTEKGIFEEILGKEQGERAYFGIYLPLYEKRHEELLPPLDSNILAVLKSLKGRKDVRTVLLTGRNLETLEISLNRTGLYPYFEKFYSGSDTGVNKPENLLHVEKDFGLRADEILYVGDSVSDCFSCLKAGVPLLSVNYFRTEKYEELQKYNPGRVISKTVELGKEIGEALSYGRKLSL
jgi:phosphoglycolate phosphatase-like HAD superfamily hydrolase